MKISFSLMFILMLAGGFVWAAFGLNAFILAVVIAFVLLHLVGSQLEF